MLQGHFDSDSDKKRRQANIKKRNQKLTKIVTNWLRNPQNNVQHFGNLGFFI
jgi:hypothetical protein